MYINATLTYNDAYTVKNYIGQYKYKMYHTYVDQG
jgi:hypothetical protein